MLRCKATLSLSKEPKHDYVGLPFIETDSTLSGLFIGLKSKITNEQNVKHFQFYICLPNFRLLGSIIKKKLNSQPNPITGVRATSSI